MEMSDILVHVDDSSDADARLKVGLRIARRLDAAITGIAVMPVHKGAFRGDPALPKEIRESLADADAQELAIERGRFQGLVGEAGMEARARWLVGHGDDADVLVRQAPFTDLIVLSQAKPDGTYAGIADDVILRAGRPVLVVPHIGPGASIGKHVLIGWNGSREATRAIGDAMPMLRLAERVDIISIGDVDADGLASRSLAKHLGQRGIAAVPHHTVTGEVAVSDVLLNTVSDFGSDMLVMGAYSHGRLRESVLGGASHEILQHMTVPVLMSH